MTALSRSHSFRLRHHFPQTKHEISIFLRLRNPIFRKHTQTNLCQCFLILMPVKVWAISQKLEHSLQTDQSVFVCITVKFVKHLGVSWGKYLSIYLACKETQLKEGGFYPCTNIKRGDSQWLQSGHSEMLCKWFLKWYHNNLTFVV